MKNTIKLITLCVIVSVGCNQTQERPTSQYAIEEVLTLELKPDQLKGAARLYSISSKGTYIVIEDYSQNLLHIFERQSDGNYQHDIIGRRGSGPKEFQQIDCIGVTDEGIIFVYDSELLRVLIVDAIQKSVLKTLFLEEYNFYITSDYTLYRNGKFYFAGGSLNELPIENHQNERDLIYSYNLEKNEFKLEHRFNSENDYQGFTNASEKIFNIDSNGSYGIANYGLGYVYRVHDMGAETMLIQNILPEYQQATRYFFSTDVQKIMSEYKKTMITMGVYFDGLEMLVQLRDIIKEGLPFRTFMINMDKKSVATLENYMIVGKVDNLFYALKYDESPEDKFVIYLLSINWE